METSNNNYAIDNTILYENFVYHREKAFTTKETIGFGARVKHLIFALFELPPAVIRHVVAIFHAIIVRKFTTPEISPQPQSELAQPRQIEPDPQLPTNPPILEHAEEPSCAPVEAVEKHNWSLKDYFTAKNAIIGTLAVLTLAYMGKAFLIGTTPPPSPQPLHLNDYNFTGELDSCPSIDAGICKAPNVEVIAEKARSFFSGFVTPTNSCPAVAPYQTCPACDNGLYIEQELEVNKNLTCLASDTTTFSNGYFDFNAIAIDDGTILKIAPPLNTQNIQEQCFESSSNFEKVTDYKARLEFPVLNPLLILEDALNILVFGHHSITALSYAGWYLYLLKTVIPKLDTDNAARTEFTVANRSLVKNIANFCFMAYLSRTYSLYKMTWDLKPLLQEMVSATVLTAASDLPRLTEIFYEKQVLIGATQATHSVKQDLIVATYSVNLVAAIPFIASCSMRYDIREMAFGTLALYGINKASIWLSNRLIHNPRPIDKNVVASDFPI